MQQNVVKMLCKQISKECSTMCALKTKALRVANTDSLRQFAWGDVANNLKRLAPTLFKVILTSCSTKRQCNQTIGGMAAALLLKERNKHIYLMQSVLSVLPLVFTYPFGTVYSIQ